jgi:hypothetical protein
LVRTIVSRVRFHSTTGLTDGLDDACGIGLSLIGEAAKDGPPSGAIIADRNASTNKRFAIRMALLSLVDFTRRAWHAKLKDLGRRNNIPGL